MSDFQVVQPPSDQPWGDADGVVLPFDSVQWKQKGAAGVFAFLPRPDVERIAAFAQRVRFSPKPGDTLAFDIDPNRRVSLCALPDPGQFLLLEAMRASVEPLFAAKSACIAIDLRGSTNRQKELVDAFVSAVIAKSFRLPKYQKQKNLGRKEPKVSVKVLAKEGLEALRAVLKRAVHITEGTNLVRYLTALAGNDLTPERYRTIARKAAEEDGLGFEFWGVDRLRKEKAGAFLAVAQADEGQGAGIIRLEYKAKEPTHSVALVGKGVTYDTGGVNIKTGGHMFGMHGDMSGSAVALALVRLASRMKLPFNVTAYLAVVQNLISEKAYRPNDVIFAANGKSIEIVDTDAEGRMALADTLVLAARQKPDLIMDFATLTGACVRAIGTAYSGAYTNRRDWFHSIVDAGRTSGERVWPFPNDSDYGRCLKSEYADIKQCRTSGGSDHIEAGYFLSQFVADTPWIHADLLCRGE